MFMKKYILILYVGTILLLSHQVSADAWSDDFSSGLSSDWIVPYGEYAVENGVLKSTGTSTPDKINGIWRASTDIIGTWTFSVYRPNDTITPYIYPQGFDIVGYQGDQPVQGLMIGYDWDKVINGNDLDPTKATISVAGLFSGNLMTVYGTYTADDLLLGWNMFKWVRNQQYEISLYMNGKLIVGPIKTLSFKDSNEYFNINVQAGAAFDDISYSPEIYTPPTKDTPFTTTNLVIGFGLATIAAISSWMVYVNYIRPRAIYEGDLTGAQHKLIKEIFKSHTVLYYTLIGQSRIDDKEVESNLKNAIPRDLFEFKHVFHPVRLSFLKLLYENLEMTSIEIKDILEIQWSEYFGHLKILKKNELVRVEEKFKDGHIRQVLSLEPKGVTEYKTLIDLLHIFLDNTVNYKGYIETAQTKLMDSDRDTFPEA